MKDKALCDKCQFTKGMLDNQKGCALGGAIMVVLPESPIDSGVLFWAKRDKQYGWIYRKDSRYGWIPCGFCSESCPYELEHFMNSGGKHG